MDGATHARLIEQKQNTCLNEMVLLEAFWFERVGILAATRYHLGMNILFSMCPNLFLFKWTVFHVVVVT